MATQNRETARDALVTLLSAALTGAGNPCQAVIGHKPGADDIAGRSPLVSVQSAGTERLRFTAAGTRPNFYFQLDTWVLLKATGWTKANAEDTLDEIEQTIAQVVEDNQATANWGALDYDGRSTIMDVAFDGVPYIREVILIKVAVLK